VEILGQLYLPDLFVRVVEDHTRSGRQMDHTCCAVTAFPADQFVPAGDLLPDGEVFDKSHDVRMASVKRL
jgi:hypothetical protein